MERPEPSPARHPFRRRHRLSLARDYTAVFNARCRSVEGPLIVHGRANGLAHPRLGLSVGRRVGPATLRARIKRLLREAFRLLQHDFPVGYDLVIVVRPHEALTLAEYQHYLHRGLRRIHRQWQQRQKRHAPDSPPAS